MSEKEAVTETVYRDSIDGTFTTREEAERRPATTEKQKVRRKPKTRKRAKAASTKGGLS